MAKIKSKDTTPEMLVRRYLYHRGYRYRKNVKGLPGSPDIVMQKYGIVIFVHGCFWHRHEGCKDATIPKTRTEFWLEKFEKNVRNDQIKQEKLKELGWKVIVIWECELKKDFLKTMERLEKELK